MYASLVHPAVAVFLALVLVVATWAWAVLLKRTIQSQTRSLELSQQRFQTLFENLSDPVLIHDADTGWILNANAAARERYGLDADELEAGVSLKRVTDLGWDTLMDRLGSSIHEGRLIFELNHRDLHGEPFPVEVHGKLVEDSGSMVLLAICRDITERRALERERLDHAVALQRTQKLRALGVLAGSMAHDLNNLLTPVLAYGDLLYLELANDPELQRTAQHIVAAAGEAREMVRRIHAVGRNQPVHVEPIDLGELVLSSEPQLREVLREDVELQVQPSPLTSPVRADEGEIRQVLLNLVHNAQDALPKGGRVEILTGDVLLEPGDVPVLEPGRYVEIMVRDDGEGMSPEVLDRVFEPFFTTRGEGSPGLGLAVVFGIISQHQGHVDAQSQPGQGTTIHVYLPPAQHELVVSPESPALIEELRGSETVLVVEDDDQVRTLAHAVLSRQGYRVMVASGGDQALEVARAWPGSIQLLVADVVMPGRNGQEVYEALSREREGLLVLYMSGYSDEVLVKGGLAESLPVLLQKPFTAADLAVAVRRVLEG